MPASGAPLKISDATGGAGKLHVPKEIKTVIDGAFDGKVALFSVELTADGILYRPVEPVEQSVPENLPDWLKP